MPVAFFFPTCTDLYKKHYLCIVERKNDKIDQNLYKLFIKKTLCIFIVQRWQVHNKIFSNLRWIKINIVPLHQKIKKQTLLTF